MQPHKSSVLMQSACHIFAGGALLLGVSLQIGGIMDKTTILESFHTIYDETFPEMRRMAVLRARSISDAEDLLQITYTAFYRQMEKHGMDVARKPEAYLKTILKRELTRYYRFKGQTEEPITEVTVFPAEEDAEELALFHLSVSEVWHCLKEEPPLSEKLFLLRYEYDMSTQEIARQLSLSDDVVRARLSRTRKKLIQKLAGKEKNDYE